EGEVAFEQAQVTKVALEYCLGRGEGQLRQHARLQRCARVERDLDGQGRAALDMRLHGAARLGELPGEGALERRAVEAEQACRRGGRAEAAGGGRPEETESRL